jgi:hypothetical protein
VVGLGDFARQGAHAADVGRPFGDRNGAARIEQVEGVRALHHHFVARQRQAGSDQAPGFGFVFAEMTEQQVSTLECSKLYFDCSTSFW